MVEHLRESVQSRSAARKAGGGIAGSCGNALLGLPWQWLWALLLVFVPLGCSSSDEEGTQQGAQSAEEEASGEDSQEDEEQSASSGEADTSDSEAQDEGEQVGAPESSAQRDEEQQSQVGRKEAQKKPAPSAAVVEQPQHLRFVEESFVITVDDVGDLDFADLSPLVFDLQIKGTGELAQQREGELLKYTGEPKVYVVKGAQLSQVDDKWIISSADFRYGEELGSGGSFFQAFTYRSKEVSVDDFSDSVLGSWWEWSRVNPLRRAERKQKAVEKLTVDGQLPALNKAETHVMVNIMSQEGMQGAATLQGDALQYLLDAYMQELDDERRLWFQGFGSADEEAFLGEIKDILALLQ